MGPGCLHSTLASLEPRQKSEAVLIRKGREGVCCVCWIVCCQFISKHEVQQQRQLRLSLCRVPGCSNVWQQDLQKTPRCAAELLKCKSHCF